MKQATILPGEEPPIPGRCNYDTLSPKRHGNVLVMGRNTGSSLSMPYYLFCFIWQGRCGVERLDPVMCTWLPD